MLEDKILLYIMSLVVSLGSLVRRSARTPLKNSEYSPRRMLEDKILLYYNDLVSKLG